MAAFSAQTLKLGMRTDVNSGQVRSDAAAFVYFIIGCTSQNEGNHSLGKRGLISCLTLPNNENSPTKQA
jgi:hypothetical protein